MKFYNTLRFKIVVFAITVEIVMLSLLILNADRLILNHMSSQTYKQIDNIRSNFQASLLPLLIERDYASLDALLDKYTYSKEIAYIFITKDNNIISSSKWDRSKGIPLSDGVLISTDTVFDTTQTIEYMGQNYGTVYFGFNTLFLKNAQNELFTQSFIIALAEVMLSVILLFSLGYFLTQHLQTLTNAAEEMSANQFDIDLKINSKDELGLLGYAFNRMARKIKNQITMIQRQDELKNAIFDNMEHILIVTDKNGVIRSFNKQAENTLGYTTEEIIDDNTPEIFFDKKDREEKAKLYSKELGVELNSSFDTVLAKTERGLKNQDYWKFITKDQKELILYLNITALKDKNDVTYGYIYVGEDKTDIFKLEKSLKEESHRLKTILENAGDFIHILNIKGDLKIYSDSFIEYLGYTKDEAKELNVVDWDKNFLPESQISELLRSQQTFEAIHTKKDGSTFDVEVKTSKIILDGEPYLYCASRDITERKISQEQIRQRDLLLQQQARLASMGEMIGNIAHQWRQPLSLISTISSSYKVKSEFNMPINSDDELNKDMVKIIDTVKHLSQTIDDFRSFFKHTNQKEIFSINKVISNCANIISASFDNHFIKLKKDIKDDSLKYNGSASMLSQAILNILSNAKDVLLENKVENKIVKITLDSMDDKTIEIKIKDNGGGVPKEIEDKIFDSHFTTKENSDGTGIGLYMSLQIMQQHFNGELLVKNKEDENGYGAEFTLILRA